MTFGRKSPDDSKLRIIRALFCCHNRSCESICKFHSRPMYLLNFHQVWWEECGFFHQTWWARRRISTRYGGRSVDFSTKIGGRGAEFPPGLVGGVWIFPPRLVGEAQNFHQVWWQSVIFPPRLVAKHKFSIHADEKRKYFSQTSPLEYPTGMLFNVLFKGHYECWKLLFACVKLPSVCIQKVAEILDGICVVLDTNVFIWPVHLGTGIAAAD